MKREESLQIAVCKYLKLQYPRIIFTSEASGLRLTQGQAKKLKAMRSGNGLPDLMIFQSNGTYHGLFLELKAVSPFKKDGKLKADKHIYEQAIVLERLEAKGYKAVFATGFDEAKKIIDEYLMPIYA